MKFASKRKSILSNYGECICRSRFDAVQVENYDIQVHAFDDVHECNVRHRKGGPVHECIIPTAPDEYGSRFGKCSCGVHATKTIPCVHMIAVTKSSTIAGLNSVNIMPSWCYTSVWREQYPEGSGMNVGFNIQYLKDNYQPNQKLHYCPKIAAAAKAGRPKNLKRNKGPLENKTKNKKAKRVKLTEVEELELGEEMKMGVV